MPRPSRTGARCCATAAASPNVAAKLSGLASAAGAPDSWTVADLRPVVAEAVDAFGPERLMYGGDWPVCLLAGGYTRTFEGLHAALDVSAAELEQIHRLSAIAWYRLEIEGLGPSPTGDEAGMSANDFEGLVAVVTGGASGIGLATALELAGRGAQVAVLDLNPEVPAPLAGFTANVADRASVDAAIAAVGERFGRIDILINNAGIGAAGTVADNDDDEWARVLNINVIGMARVSTAALPWLRESPAGAIVNTSSIAAQSGLPLRALYSASKGAVLALTRAMATDHVREGDPGQLRVPRHRRDALGGPPAVRRR